MQKPILLVLLASTLFNLQIFASSPAVLRGANAEEILNGAETVREGVFSDIPSYVQFRDGAEVSVEQFPAYFAKVFSTDENLGIQELRREQDKLGMLHIRYTQTWNGIPIDGSFLILHTRNGMVESFNGNMYNDIDLPMSSTVSEANALASALDDIGADVYKWELPGEEEHLRWETGDPSATYQPKGTLTYMTKDASFLANDIRLCWKFNIYAHQPVSRAEYYVDALTGEMVFANQILVTADAPGTAVTAYNGNQSIVADSYQGGFRLRESGRGNGIRTFDMNQGTNYGSAVDFTDGDNFWNNVNAQLDQYAGDAHFGSEATYDYYFLEHGRNSIDGNGFTLNTYMHYDQNFVNAFWDGQRMTYGDGNGGFSPLVPVDVVAHEITHGLTSFSANLIYQNESGALNESFSDIFGTSVEFYATPNNADWFIGEDIGSAFRSMSNPKSRNDPDTYLGLNWFTGTGNNGGVHTNNGVSNHWYYLLSEGGTGTNDNGDSYNVDGIGIDTAGQIAFRNLTVYLGPSTQYADARFFAIQSAIDLYGPCTTPVISTANAWYAVGVGVQFDTTVNSDFVAGATESCTAPFTVDFTNLSTNAGSYTWNFGDGTPTSSTTDPSHTYNAIGDYTVTLIADGGRCGIETEVKTAYISIQNDNPCIHLISEEGVKNTCEGTLFDDGGPTGDYSANANYTMTIAPTGAASVVLEFDEFDIEAGQGANCNFDYIEIFDGANASAPSLGRFCNTTGDPGRIVSSGTALTIQFVSDGGLELPGFKASWHCNKIGVPPVAQFTSDVVTTCTGEVNFIDQSFSFPSSWLWEFGDGATSTAQNPTHNYANSGVYEVKLTASNTFGTDTILKVDYISVTKTAAPSGSFSSRCGVGTVDLSATAAGSGLLYWFNSPTSGTVEGIGTVFTTPSLSATTSYWAEEWITPAMQTVGPPSNNFGTGGNFTGERVLYFDAIEDFTLISVLAYAEGAGARTFIIRDPLGNTIVDSVVNLVDGANRVTLNWEIPQGNSYSFGANASPDLYRNRTGATYPYTIPGVVSITGSDATSSAGFYYYFYDWEVQEKSCRSDRTEIIAVVTLDPVADFSFSPTGGGPVNFFSNAQNATTVRYDFGDGNTSNQLNPSHTYASPGTYDVVMIASNSCGSDTTKKTVNTEATGIGILNESFEVKLFPNPASTTVAISAEGLEPGLVEIQLFDVSGRAIYQGEIESFGGTFEADLSVSELSAGMYIVRLTNDGKEQRIKFTKE